MIDVWMAARCMSVSFIHMLASSSAWITMPLAKLAVEKPDRPPGVPDGQLEGGAPDASRLHGDDDPLGVQRLQQVGEAAERLWEELGG